MEQFYFCLEQFYFRIELFPFHMEQFYFRRELFSYQFRNPTGYREPQKPVLLCEGQTRPCAASNPPTLVTDPSHLVSLRMECYYASNCHRASK